MLIVRNFWQILSHIFGETTHSIGPSKTTPIGQQVRARTTSPYPALRFLLMGIALLIVNMWIRLHWLYLRFSGQGPRRVARARFRLERMMCFLSRAIERVYGVISAVDPPPKPRPVIY